MRALANLQRKDGVEFPRLAPQMGIVMQITRCALEQGNDGLPICALAAFGAPRFWCLRAR
jgi:hypothetical protein